MSIGWDGVCFNYWVECDAPGCAERCPGPDAVGHALVEGAENYACGRHWQVTDDHHHYCPAHRTAVVS